MQVPLLVSSWTATKCCTWVGGTLHAAELAIISNSLSPVASFVTHMRFTFQTTRMYICLFTALGAK